MYTKCWNEKVKREIKFVGFQEKVAEYKKGRRKLKEYMYGVEV